MRRGKRNPTAKWREAVRKEAFGQLAAVVAHEFNNILASITVHAESVAAAPAAEPGLNLHGYQILASSRRAAELIHELLSFANRLTPEGDPTDIFQDVATALEQVRPSLGPEIQLIFRKEEICGVATVDRILLRRAVTRLVLNARDAIAESGTIRVRVRGEDAGDPNRIAITVEDSGAGMPPEVMARIFEPFFTTKAHSHGLGLSMVKEFVHQAGGTIEVVSAPGTGSKFTLSFPKAI